MQLCRASQKRLYGILYVDMRVTHYPQKKFTWNLTTKVNISESDHLLACEALLIYQLYKYFVNDHGYNFTPSNRIKSDKINGWNETLSFWAVYQISRELHVIIKPSRLGA